MGHVRDVDPYFLETASEATDGEGIVVILGVGRVDGEDHEVRPVHPVLPGIRRRRLRRALRGG